FGGRARRSTLLSRHAAGTGRRRQRVGEPAPQPRGRRGTGHRRRVQRDQRGLDARPVPRLGAPHGGGAGHVNEEERQELVQFTYAEAALLDAGRLDEWYELFTDD